jgi:hypothetical protein
MQTMIRAIVLALVGMGLALSSAARAQGAELDNQDSRFSFYRAEGGFLRLDGRSGEVSMCTRHGPAWVCEGLPEERAAYDAEIARLQADNAVLKKEFLAHSLPLPAGVLPDAVGPSGGIPRIVLRGDREMHRMIDAIGVAWRRLVEMVAGLQKYVQKDLRKRS